MIKLYLARRLFRSRKQATHHYDVRAGGYSLGQITREADAAIGDHANVCVFECFNDVGYGSHLRHAHAGNDARGADRAGADAYFHCVCAGCREVQSRLRGRDVATNNRQVRVFSLNRFDLIDNALRMAVGCIDNHHVYSCLDYCVDTVGGIWPRTNRSGNPQAAVLVFTGVRVVFGFANIFECNEASKLEGLVNHQQLLDSVTVQKLFYFA